MATFHLTIATPESQTFSAEVSAVTLPTTEGEITILPHHQALVTLLAPGALHIRHEAMEELYAVTGGFIEVQGGRLTVLADAAERAEEIDAAAAEEARTRALERLTQLQHNTEEFAEARATLLKNLARLHAVERLKHRSRRHPHTES